MAIPAYGSLLVAEDDDTLGVQANYVLPGALNFENSDNVTHFLAMKFYGFLGDDLDSDDDENIDILVDLLEENESYIDETILSNFVNIS